MFAKVRGTGQTLTCEVLSSGLSYHDHGFPEASVADMNKKIISCGRLLNRFDNIKANSAPGACSGLTLDKLIRLPPFFSKEFPIQYAIVAASKNTATNLINFPFPEDCSHAL